MDQENYPNDWEDWMYDQWERENEDEEEVEPTLDLL